MTTSEIEAQKSREPDGREPDPNLQALHPAWQPLIDALSEMPPDEYARRCESALAMLRDNGVTYNVYGNADGEASDGVDTADGQSRRWHLDIVPFVIAPEDWAFIERAAIQRARLADALLADIYGPQTLIADGFLPAHIVFGHPQYLRPLMGVEPLGGTRVHLYSLDLARLADGSWMVLSSRADSANGIGYALENRIVVKQIFPEQFADMRVRRLASFFNDYRAAIRTLAEPLCEVDAKGKKQDGRAVFLTPGPHNEAYFEHAFLAHYLDLTLVEGDDLVTHNDRVYLRTIRGRERVTAIFRRVDSDYCDPLELRGDSALGVPGLINAVRKGNVVLANALGGGVVESPAMDAYLPGIAKALLGEDLIVPDIPTVWGGTQWGRKEMFERLERVIVRDAFDARPLFSRRSTARQGCDLTAADVAALQERLTRRGAAVVTQDIVKLGRAPVYRNGRIDSKPATLRLFVAWTGQRYEVMPGALVRTGESDSVMALPLQSGAASKDAWVPSVGPLNTFSLLRAKGDSLEIKETGSAPPSRAMDNLFWLGRYSERADNQARILRTVVKRMGEKENDDADDWQDFLARLARLKRPAGQGATNEEADEGGESTLASGLGGLIADRRNPEGLAQLLFQVRHAAWSARDRLSLDTWQTIDRMTNPTTLPAGGAAFDMTEAQSFLDRQIRRAAAFSGFCAENMTRGPNWLFTDLGRRIERADHLTWLIGLIAAPCTTPEVERIRIALEIAGSTMTYRSRYLNFLQMRPLIHLLLLDETNPQSVAFQMKSMEAILKELWYKAPVERTIATAPALRFATDMRHSLLQADLLGEDLSYGALSAHLEKIETDLCTISDAVTDAYFRHTERRRTEERTRGERVLGERMREG